MSDPIIEAVQDRLAVAFASWTDVTGDPYNKPPTALPSYAVTLVEGEAERTSMGEDRFFQPGDLTVTLWAKKETWDATLPPAPANPERAMRRLAKAVRAALLADPSDLGGAVWEIIPGALDVSHDHGQERVSRAEQTFTITSLTGS
ncbi:MAG: hypothetical protein AAF376_08910 [Pseudomonadota bacterium]